MEIMDLDSFLTEMDHDSDVVNMILTELIRSIDAQIPYIKSLLVVGDYSTLSREAHSIKGGARNIMAEGLEKASEKLEFCAKDENLEQVELALNNLIFEYDRFTNFILQHNLVHSL